MFHNSGSSPHSYPTESRWNSYLDSSVNKTMAQSFSFQLWKFWYQSIPSLRLPINRGLHLNGRERRLTIWKRFLTVSRLTIKLCVLCNSVTNLCAWIFCCILGLTVKNLSWVAFVECPSLECCSAALPVSLKHLHYRFNTHWEHLFAQLYRLVPYQLEVGLPLISSIVKCCRSLVKQIIFYENEWNAAHARSIRIKILTYRVLLFVVISFTYFRQ